MTSVRRIYAPLWAFINFAHSMICGTLDNLILLHTNDVHSRILSFNANTQRCTSNDTARGTCWGGAAKRLTLIKSIRAAHENVLLLDAGDQFQGSAWYTLMKWKPIAVTMNLMNYSVATIGNHEFDDGDENLADYLRSLNFPVISSNINFNRSQSLSGLVQKYQLVEINGETIAFIGCTTIQTPDISSPSQSLIFNDEVLSFNALINDLKRTKQINKFIAISHSGIQMDRKICASVPDLALIVGGHSHTFMYQGTPPLPNEVPPEASYPEVVRRSSGPCLIVQAYEYGKYLGFLRVSFNETGQVTNWTGNPILVDASIRDDSETVERLKDFGNNISTLMDEVVATTTTPMTSVNGFCRIQECPLGNFVTDSILDYAKIPLQKHSALFGFLGPNEPLFGFVAMNSGILRHFSTRAGVNVTIRDLYNMLPFSNKVTTILLNGTLVRQLFQHSIQNFSLLDRRGKFLQVSNANVTYFLNCSSGQYGLQSVKIGCLINCQNVSQMNDLDDERPYLAVVTSYLSNGGDGYKFVRDHGIEYKVTGNDLDIDVLLQFIRKFGGRMGGKVEGRSVFRRENGSC